MKLQMELKQVEQQLEAMVDARGLRVVVDALASVCRAKAEHLASAWQDEASARCWVADAEALDAVEVSS